MLIASFCTYKETNDDKHSDSRMPCGIYLTNEWDEWSESSDNDSCQKLNERRRRAWCYNWETRNIKGKTDKVLIKSFIICALFSLLLWNSTATKWNESNASGDNLFDLIPCSLSVFAAHKMTDEKSIIITAWCIRIVFVDDSARL